MGLWPGTQQEIKSEQELYPYSQELSGQSQHLSIMTNKDIEAGPYQLPLFGGKCSKRLFGFGIIFITLNIQASYI